MPFATNVEAFITKWERNPLNERAVAHEHFADLCRLLQQPTPNDPNPLDPSHESYRFEKPLTKVGGKAGFADVWKRGHFVWEYKTKGKYPTLDEAYKQLLLYKEDLENPPVLVACDIARYEVHIGFTGYRTRIEAFEHADLRKSETRKLLHAIFTTPDKLRPQERVETITEEAASHFATVARLLEQRGFAPTAVAHFFMRVVFALFAEDIHLLPGELMSKNIREAILKPHEFQPRLQALFQKMRDGGFFGNDLIPHFDGGLFDDDRVLPLNPDELTYLGEAAKLDWSAIEPSIFGTLFERAIDKTKRAQLGLHYTSKTDILTLLEPVLLQPLRLEWARIKRELEPRRAQLAQLQGGKLQQLKHHVEGLLLGLLGQLADLRVLDPACGSGNFLYVALHELKDLEKEIRTYAVGLGLPPPELSIHPRQFYGLEKNPFAAELAQIVVWIGYFQWRRMNGLWDYEQPILQPLETIQCRDAILEIGLDGQPQEPTWPEVDVILGNPPFLGGKRIRQEMGDRYVEALFKLYQKRVPHGADIVCYWFEKARSQLVQGEVKRVGLLATQGIRGGANRKVLERIKADGEIFFAWSDREWILDGATVHISMIGFDAGQEQNRTLDGQAVAQINADLTASVDLTLAQKLAENDSVSFMGDIKVGPFDIDADLAQQLLVAENPLSGKSNSDVIRPWANGFDIVRRPRNMWIIDFGVDMSEEEAAQYEAPFAYVRQHVKPTRDSVRFKSHREKWWLHGAPRPEMRQTLAPLSRYIGTSRVAKHRIFTWLRPEILPDSTIVVFAREDDYFLGVLQSKVHELWARRMGTQLRDAESGSRYTSTTTFGTFPCPWPPGQEPAEAEDGRVEAIAAAARGLVGLREAWLNPPGLGAQELAKRTLTNLYNARPAWLEQAHAAVDAAVLAAYGWPSDLAAEELLRRLLALNQARRGRK